MSTTRLLVLGMLAERGPMHGHQLRRQAELVNIEAWGGVRVGALYGALHRMEAEGLIEPLRSEQPGRFPARTIYAITDEGRTELGVLQDRALQEAHLDPDPFDVALMTLDLPQDEVLRLTAQRRIALTAKLDELVTERERLEAAGVLPRNMYIVFRHGELRVRAELAALDEFIAVLPEIVAQKQARREQTQAATESAALTIDVVPIDPARRASPRRRQTR